MMNKKLLILLVALVVVAIGSLVWVVLRAPITPINPNTDATNDFPIGNLDSIDPLIKPGDLSNPNTDNQIPTSNPSSNPRLQPLTNLQIADFWLEPKPKASSSPEVWYLTRRSAEIFSVPLMGGEAVISTSAVRPDPNTKITNTNTGIEVVVGNKTVFTSPLKDWRIT